MRIWLGALALFLAGPLTAAAPEVSLRPMARTPVIPILAQVIATPAPTPSLAPTPAAVVRPIPPEAYSALPPIVSLRPILRPRDLRNLPQSTPVASRRDRVGSGTVCNSRDIQGEVVGLVPGRLPACGINNAVRVTAVSGVALSTPALMNCRTAKALRRWVDRGLKPAVGSYGGGVVQMTVVGHYSCRTRNNQPGARISEHGKGNAIDLAAFTFADGSRITVLNDWNRGRPGRMLRRMHRSACGPFGTVIGPDGDRFHQDHFHFDTARNNYCR